MNTEHDHNSKTKGTGSNNIWWRALYMLLFAVLYSVAEVVLVAVIVFQFLAKLITKKTNENLLSLGQSLSTYIYQILRFLTFNSDSHPYPFAPWPKEEPKQSGTSDKSEME